MNMSTAISYTGQSQGKEHITLAANVHSVWQDYSIRFRSISMHHCRTDFMLNQNYPEVFAAIEDNATGTACTFHLHCNLNVL